MKNKYFILLTLALGAFSINSYGIKPEMVTKQQTEEIKTGFMKLPRDIQMLIITAINKGDADATFKEIARLREVNKTFKSIIEDETRGKYIFETVAAKYPEQKLAAVNAALGLYTPATIAWLKNQITQDPIMQEYAKYAFEIAAFFNHTKLVKHALEFGINPNETHYQFPGSSGSFDHAICHAIHNKNIELVKLLIHYKANLLVPCSIKYSNTLMYASSIEDNLEIVKLLVEAGVPINAIDHQRRRTALDIAMEFIAYGHREVSDYLRSKGAKTFEELT